MFLNQATGLADGALDGMRVRIFGIARRGSALPDATAEGRVTFALGAGTAAS